MSEEFNKALHEIHKANKSDAVGLSTAERVVSQHEGCPRGWARVVLMVSPDGKELHAIGGDREHGDGDMPYIGLERIKKASAG
jgi:hypothetical protein